MNLNAFFSKKELQLPLLPEKQDKNNIEFLENVFEDYQNNIRDNFSNDIDIESIKDLCSFIINSIKAYYNGTPSDAVEILKSSMEISKIIYNLPQKKYVKTRDSKVHFYRLRTSEESNPLKRKELFHIPFDLRNKISPQRFSIPGYPCLYLGTSVYICWEELNRPDFNRVQAARFENDKDFSVVNLCYTQYRNISDKVTDEEKKTLIMSYPIIAACSLKVPTNKQNDPFKLEYIFPQILMQVLLNLKDKTTIGIVYSTTKFYKEGSKNTGSFENIVIPTIPDERKKSKYCNKLKDIFLMTDVIVGKPIEFLRFDETLNKDSFQIEQIELNGLPDVSYSQTKFALLEYLLMEKKAETIKNDFEGE